MDWEKLQATMDRLAALEAVADAARAVRDCLRAGHGLTSADYGWLDSALDALDGERCSKHPNALTYEGACVECIADGRTLDAGGLGTDEGGWGEGAGYGVVLR